MFERIPDVGGPVGKFKGVKKPENIVPPQGGMPCPYGCEITAWRLYGMVSHLMEKHRYTEKNAWRKVHED
jgi:hypothetical protein